MKDRILISTACLAVTALYALPYAVVAHNKPGWTNGLLVILGLGALTALTAHFGYWIRRTSTDIPPKG